MNKRILAGIVLSGALATSTAQAAGTNPSIEELYSGMSATAIQKDQRANPAAERHSAAGKPTCSWHEGMNEANPLYAAYPGDEYVEKAYLSPANQRFVC